MKHTTAAIVVLAALAAATGQDTVKLPQVVFLVTDVLPGRATESVGIEGWWLKPTKKYSHDYGSAQFAQWFVYYAVAGESKARMVRLRKTGRALPTRQQIAKAIRMAEALHRERPRYAPKGLDALLGYYAPRKVKPPSPSTTTRPSSTRPTAPGSGRRRPRPPSRSAR